MNSEDSEAEGVLHLLGKTWPEDWSSANKSAWINSNVQFGDYDIVARAEIGSMVAAVNPGIKFLIGINSKATEQLLDRPIPINSEKLAFDKSIIVQVGSYQEDFNHIANLLDHYDKKWKNDHSVDFYVKLQRAPNLDLGAEAEKLGSL